MLSIVFIGFGVFLNFRSKMGGGEKFSTHPEGGEFSACCEGEAKIFNLQFFGILG